MKKETKVFALSFSKLLIWVIAGILFVVGSVALFVVLPIQPAKNELSKIGLTFSTRASMYLGLDWKENYDAMIDELSPDILRIPIYWHRLEEERDIYNWDDFDYQLSKIEGTDTQIILAIGHKLPRWPECHIPQWINELGYPDIEDELFQMVADVVEKYKDHPNLYAWQVENEALFPFGNCPEWSKKDGRSRLKRLIKLVKSIDPDHKVNTSDSGELSLWLRTSTLPIDALDISLYRVAYNPKHDYFYWPVNPYFYKLHIWLVRPFVREVIISELQMEPWGPDTVDNLDQQEINLSFPSEAFAERLDFAQRTGASVVLGWGVEWWYYMKEIRGDSTYWDQAVESFSK